MKTALVILLALVIPGFSEGVPKSILGISICNSLVSELYVMRDSGTKDLPKSWDEFESIRLMRDGSLSHQLSRAKAINSLSLVPSSPVIGSDSEMPREYRGRRLFLISREENFTKSTGSGRCAILIKPEDLDSKPLIFYSEFIPEKIARLILSRISNFDPAREPIAFKDLSKFELEEKQFRDNIRTPSNSKPLESSKETVENYPAGGSRSDSGLSSQRKAEGGGIPFWAGVAILVGGLLWVILKKWGPSGGKDD